MPAKKTTTKKTVAKKSAEAKATTVDKKDELMEFEEFVATKRKDRKGSFRGWLALFLVIVIILMAMALLIDKKKSAQPTYDSTYKAVTLDTGQVFYAIIQKEDDDTIYLKDVYYIQLREQTIPAEDEEQEDQVITVPVLIQRGSEIHQPDGSMEINRAKVVSVEDIGEDSEILKEIERRKSQN